ncbi:MAG: 30S ribosomal protein S6 [Chryseolinea sp.]
MAKKDQYEGMFLFPGNAEVEASTKRVQSIIEAHGGQVIVIKKWDERKLAYELKKQKRGLFILAYFTAPGPAIAQVNRDVNLSDDIMRVLITDASHLTKDEMEKVEPQPIAPPPTYGDRPSFEGGFGGGGFRGGDRGGDRGGFRRRDEEPANT